MKLTVPEGNNYRPVHWQQKANLMSGLSFGTVITILRGTQGSSQECLGSKTPESYRGLTGATRRRLHAEIPAVVSSAGGQERPHTKEGTRKRGRSGSACLTGVTIRPCGGSDRFGRQRLLVPRKRMALADRHQSEDARQRRMEPDIDVSDGLLPGFDAVQEIAGVGHGGIDRRLAGAGLIAPRLPVTLRLDGRSARRWGRSAARRRTRPRTPGLCAK